MLPVISTTQKIWLVKVTWVTNISIPMPLLDKDLIHMNPLQSVTLYRKCAIANNNVANSKGSLSQSSWSASLDSRLFWDFVFLSTSLGETALLRLPCLAETALPSWNCLALLKLPCLVETALPRWICLALLNLPCLAESALLNLPCLAESALPCWIYLALLTLPCLAETVLLKPPCLSENCLAETAELRVWVCIDSKNEQQTLKVSSR